MSVHILLGDLKESLEGQKFTMQILVYILIYSMASFLSTLSMALAQQISGPRLEIIPSIVETTPQKDQLIHAEAHLQSGSQRIFNIQLSAFSNDELSLIPERQDTDMELQELLPSSEYVWPLNILRTSPFLTAAKMYVKAEFSVEGTANPTVRRFLYGTVTINAPPAAMPLTLAQAEIKGGLVMVSQQRPSQVLLIVTNRYVRPLLIERISHYVPNFVEITPFYGPSTTDSSEMTVAPGASKTFVYQISAADQVAPGRYALMFSVDFTSTDHITGTVVATQESEIGILGESDILKLIGVPSFLLVPGFLFLIILRLLVMLPTVQTDISCSLSILQVTNAEFWAIAIFLSLCLAYTYPWMSDMFFHTHRDYLVAYGLIDFVFVYTIAILLSVFTFAAWRLVIIAQTRVRAVKLARTVPNVTDEPMKILGKLAKCHSKLTFTMAYRKDRSPSERLFVLPWPNQTSMWLAPPILVKLKDENNHEAMNARDRVTVGNPDDAQVAYKILKNGLKKQWWELSWYHVGEINGPVSLPQKDIVTLPNQNRLLKDDSIEEE